MNEKNLDDLSHRTDSNEKFDQLKQALEGVEKKYGDYFKERPSHVHGEEHDSLFDHCVINKDSVSGVIRFFFTDTELPQHIIDECHDAVKRVLPDATYIPPG